MILSMPVRLYTYPSIQVQLVRKTFNTFNETPSFKSLQRLGTIFYLSYLVFEFPQNLCLQHFPVAKWMRYGLQDFKTLTAAINPHSSFNISIWAVALCAHAACKNFAGLFVVRLILGMCEGSITAGFLIVSSMFYTRNEQTLRVGYWCKLLIILSMMLTMRFYWFDSYDERHWCG